MGDDEKYPPGSHDEKDTTDRSREKQRKPWGGPVPRDREKPKEKPPKLPEDR